MSSIDKYVATSAKEYNPKVHVYKSGGKIIGTINGHTVFSLRDRIGYLSSDEERVIRTSIEKYERNEQEMKERERLERERLERERLERERLERERLERERIERERREKELAEKKRQEKYNELKSKISATKQRLAASKKEMLNAVAATEANLDFSTLLNNLGGNFNIESFHARAEALVAEVSRCRRRIEDEYERKLGQIKAVTYTERDSISQYQEAISRVTGIGVNISEVRIPTDKIIAFRREIASLRAAIDEVNKIAAELKKMEFNGLSSVIVSATLKEIGEWPIAKISDARRLIAHIQSKIEEIRNIEISNNMNAHNTIVESLNGLLSACYSLREFDVQQTYVARGNKEEILEKANKILKLYGELDKGDYTTCSKDRIDMIISTIQSIVVRGASDEDALTQLNAFENEYRKYKINDELLSDSYRDYLSKRQILLENNISLKDIGEFDPHDCERQINRLNEMVANLEIEAAISRARMSYIHACTAMEEMGYLLLNSNFGSVDDTETHITNNEDALACEALFVIPGCEGVVWQLIVTDQGIIRRLKGIRRGSNNLATDIARVKEVARIIDNSGEVEQYYSRYIKLSQSEAMPEYAVDTNTENVDDIIRELGYVMLDTPEMEEAFNQMVASGSEEDKQKWASRIKGANNGQILAAVGSAQNDRSDIARRRADEIRQRTRNNNAN